MQNVEGKKYIFGSRIDDNKKGGDIDLLIFTKNKSFKETQRIAVEFFKNCESKLDVILINPEKITDNERTFLATIKMEEFK